PKAPRAASSSPGPSRAGLNDGGMGGLLLVRSPSSPAWPVSGSMEAPCRLIANVRGGTAGRRRHRESALGAGSGAGGRETGGWGQGGGGNRDEGGTAAGADQQVAADRRAGGLLVAP